MSMTNRMEWRTKTVSIIIITLQILLLLRRRLILPVNFLRPATDFNSPDDDDHRWNDIAVAPLSESLPYLSLSRTIQKAICYVDWLADRQTDRETSTTLLPGIQGEGHGRHVTSVYFKCGNNGLLIQLFTSIYRLIDTGWINTTIYK